MDLTFAKPCTYTLPNGEQRSFGAGIHRNVPDEIGGNWFVQAHLVKDGAKTEVSEAAPLTHEERLKVTAAMEAAEGRAKGAEAERDAAIARADTLQEQLDAEKLAHAETMALAEAATAPETDEFAGKPYGIKRRGQGKFAVVKHGDSSFAQDGLSKVDALAKAREMNAAA